MEKNKNNREMNQTAMKTVGGKKRKLIIITTDHDDDDDNKKRSWSDLPYELLELIKKGLFFIDQVNFRVVCKSWSCIPRVAPLQQIPWLLVFDNMDSYLFRNKYNIKTKERNMVDSCKLVDPKNQKTYTIHADVIKAKLNITDFGDMRVHESKYGWLLISRLDPTHTRLYLYSPFFSEGYNFIELPVLMNCTICFATFTSNPLDKDYKILTLSSNFRDNTVFWKENCDNTIRISTYRCGQGSWSSQDLECKFKNRDARHWIYFEESLYYRTCNGTMGKFNLALEEWTVLPRVPLSVIYHQHYKVTSSDGELFLIVECNVKKRQNCSNHESHIYRLDLSSMIWENLDSIGDRVLFFGDGYNSVLDSSVLKLNGERKDISDMIYYCNADELRYCSVHDFTLKLGENEKPTGRQHCSRHYGSIATKHCRKMLIDPPPR